MIDKNRYIIYDYQMYISNDEIRQNSNPALPNICAFERWNSSYQPVQGRIDIANPTGLRSGETATKPF